MTGLYRKVWRTAAALVIAFGLGAGAHGVVTAEDDGPCCAVFSYGSTGNGDDDGPVVIFGVGKGALGASNALKESAFIPWVRHHTSPGAVGITAW